MIPRAIVVGGQAPGLAAVRSLGRRGVSVALASYSASDPARRSRFVDKVFDVPDPLMDEAGFVEHLASAATDWRGSVLLASCDQSALALARWKDTLAEIFRVGSPNLSAVERFVDKQHTYRLAAEVGVPAPRTVTPRDRRAAEDAIAGFAFPVLIKPSLGHAFERAFGTKMFEVADPAAALRAYDQSVAHGLEVMIQEIIEGPPELGVNHIVLAVEGELVAQFTARKIRNWPAEYGSPSAVVSAWIPEVTDATRALLAAVKYDGFACAEYKLDRKDGRYKLMEVNVRHNLSGALAPRCGVDFPWLHYQVTAGLPVATPNRFKEGVYWVDSLRDLRHLGRRIGMRALSAFFRPYIARGPDARWAWSDPAPFADAAIRLAGKFLGTIGAAISGPASGLVRRVLGGTRTAELKSPTRPHRSK
jgi:predicted ATP-grasp superfamily ATP-dependent carboligase